MRCRSSGRGRQDARLTLPGRNYRASGRGFFLVDLVMALVLSLALLVAMAEAVTRLHWAQRELAFTRASMRQLEHAALALQAGEAPEKDIKVERLSTAPNGKVWVRISSGEWPAKGQSLIALVPADNAGRAP
jgi:hypothetical protein